MNEPRSELARLSKLGACSNKKEMNYMLCYCSRVRMKFTQTAPAAKQAPATNIMEY
jgi:hypothetical protein